MKVSLIKHSFALRDKAYTFFGLGKVHKFTSFVPIEERTHSPQMQLRGHPARPQTCAGFWKYKVSRIFWHSFHFLCMSAKSPWPCVRCKAEHAKSTHLSSSYASTKINPVIYKSKLLHDRKRIYCAKNRKSLITSLPKKTCVLPSHTGKCF